MSSPNTIAYQAKVLSGRKINIFLPFLYMFRSVVTCYWAGYRVCVTRDRKGDVSSVVFIYESAFNEWGEEGAKSRWKQRRGYTKEGKKYTQYTQWRLLSLLDSYFISTINSFSVHFDSWTNLPYYFVCIRFFFIIDCIKLTILIACYEFYPINYYQMVSSIH